MTTRDETHSGYTNYETFGVSLVLNNDRTGYNMLRDIARDADEGTIHERADRLKAYVETLTEGYSNDLAGLLQSQLLQAALSRVNWVEIINEARED